MPRMIIVNTTPPEPPESELLPFAANAKEIISITSYSLYKENLIVSKPEACEPV